MFSPVVALILTLLDCIPKIFDKEFLIDTMKGESFGVCKTIVASTFTTENESFLSLLQTSNNIFELSIPLFLGNMTILAM